jgi:hypothetical protein
VNVCSQKKNNGPIILVALIAYHTPTLTTSTHVAKRYKIVILIVYISSEFKPNATTKQRLRGLFIHHTVHKQSSSQNAVTHDDLCRRVCEPRLYYMYVVRMHLFRVRLLSRMEHSPLKLFTYSYIVRIDPVPIQPVLCLHIVELNEQSGKQMTHTVQHAPWKVAGVHVCVNKPPLTVMDSFISIACQITYCPFTCTV